MALQPTQPRRDSQLAVAAFGLCILGVSGSPIAGYVLLLATYLAPLLLAQFPVSWKVAFGGGLPADVSEARLEAAAQVVCCLILVAIPLFLPFIPLWMRVVIMGIMAIELWLTLFRRNTGGTPKFFRKHPDVAMKALIAGGLSTFILLLAGIAIGWMWGCLFLFWYVVLTFLRRVAGDVPVTA